MENLKQYKDTKYFVSEDGKIYSTVTNKWLKPSNNKGYLRVHPHVNNKHTNLWVHRLVAEAFIPNPENKPFVLHKDNNPLNNHKDNLCWGTQSENIQQAYNQKRICAKGENNGQARLCTKAVKIMREAREKGFTVKDIAGYFKMNRSYVNGILTRRSWTHI